MRVLLLGIFASGFRALLSVALASSGLPVAASMGILCAGILVGSLVTTFCIKRGFAAGLLTLIERHVLFIAAFLCAAGVGSPQS